MVYLHRHLYYILVRCEGHMPTKCMLHGYNIVGTLV